MLSEFASIPNIIADEEVFLELIQSEASSENIAHDLTSNLADYEFRQEMIKSVKDKLTQTNLGDFVERLYDDCRS
jgi:lipid A disaccharide synthetase